MNDFLTKEQNKIFVEKDCIKACLFSSYVPGANIEDLQNLVLDRGDNEDAYFFAKHVPNADVEKLQQIVLDHGDEEFIKKFEEDVLQNADSNAPR